MLRMTVFIGHERTVCAIINAVKAPGQAMLARRDPVLQPLVKVVQVLGDSIGKEGAVTRCWSRGEKQ